MMTGGILGFVPNTISFQKRRVQIKIVYFVRLDQKDHIHTLMYENPKAKKVTDETLDILEKRMFGIHDISKEMDFY